MARADVMAVTVLGALLLSWSNAAAGKLPAVTIETGVDRPGGDYRSFDVGDASAATCRRACGEDRRCRAYTFVRLGVQGKLARCWLKDSVPKPRAGACCDSGVKPGLALPQAVATPAAQALAVPEAQRVRSVEVLLQVHIACYLDVLTAPIRLGVSLVKEGSRERTDLWVERYRTDTLIGPYRRIDWYRGRADLTPGVYSRAFYQADYRARYWGGIIDYGTSRECAHGVRTFPGRRLTPVDRPLSPSTYGSGFSETSPLLPHGALLILRAGTYPEPSPSLPAGASLPPPTPVE
jgi:hypothetical protein